MCACLRVCEQCVRVCAIARVRVPAHAFDGARVRLDVDDVADDHLCVRARVREQMRARVHACGSECVRACGSCESVRVRVHCARVRVICVRVRRCVRDLLLLNRLVDRRVQLQLHAGNFRTRKLPEAETSEEDKRGEMHRGSVRRTRAMRC